MTFKHCDDYIDDLKQPECLRKFLEFARAPAIEQMGPKPKLFATYKGKRYRVNMASRFGDVGINPNFNEEYGYQVRVAIEELSDFSEKCYGDESL
jgi:hypothetical protein